MKTFRLTENTARIRLLQVVGTVLGLLVLLSVLAVALMQGKSASIATQMKSPAAIIAVKFPDMAVQSQVVGVPIAYTIASNQFRRPNCTWWANERYRQLHGSYISWSGNARTWAGRAHAAGWHVSSQAQVGDIIVIQAGVQGAGKFGHVAIVEQIRGGGNVLTSDMNWGSSPWRVTFVQFHAGAGVSFIHR